jgi:hypothetical protein
MKKHICLILLLITSILAISQSVNIEWQQCYGGTDADNGKSIKMLDNGHLITLSSTQSNDIDVSFNHGDFDFWLFRTDELGNLLWEKSFGGSAEDIPVEVMLSPDGGFILFGETWSNDGDVSGNHGGADYWLLKTDSVGNILWQRCLGSSMNNLPQDMDMDDEGNIYVMGLSLGVGGDVTSSNGGYDYWFTKISPDGLLIWDKNLGGSYSDNGLCITSTNDGGIIVGGIINDTDGDITCNQEPWNKTAWVVKLDSMNNIEWQQCYGGTYTESVVDIKSTNDGGYILLGLTNSNDGDVTDLHGIPGTNDNFDIWVIKTDSIGNIEWQHCLGGTHFDNAEFIEITPQGNYLVGGSTNSHDGDVSGNHSLNNNFDNWLIKLDSDGVILWQRCFGSISSNKQRGIYVISEMEFIIIGSPGSENNSGDVSCDLKGNIDVWMYKIIDTTVGINELELNNSEINIYPNPASKVLNIDFPNNYNIENTNIEIIDMNGKTILKSKPLSISTQLNIKKLNYGLYLVKIQKDNALITKRIIIQ